MLNSLKQKSILIDLALSTKHLPSWRKLIACMFLFILASIFINRYLYIISEKQALERYVNRVIDRTQQAIFQMSSGLKQAHNLNDNLCSSEGLAQLKVLMLKYPYVEDIGRIDGNNQLRCSAIWGNLSPAIKLPENLSRDSSFDQSWPIIENLFVEQQDRMVVRYQEVFVIPSPTIFLEIPRNNQKTGSVLFSAQENTIYQLLNDISLQEAQHIINHPNDGIPLIPSKDSSISIKICPAGFNFCVAGIDKRIGIFDMPYWQWLTSIVMGLVACLLFLNGITRFKESRLSLHRRLKKALKHNDIYSLYQPKIELATGKIVGVEALARWNDKLLGFVSPDQFIHCAEQKGLITRLTRQLVEKNIKDMTSILKNNPDFTLSINLSIQDLADSSLLHYIDRLIHKQGIQAEQIVFEVTERSAVENSTLKQTTKRFLRKGYKMSIDDFGTGFSNLSWLTAFQPNEIKIDKIFIQSIGTQSVNQITLNGIFQLVSNLDVKLVFEGIESLDEAKYLVQHSPDAIGQGWLYSKAIDPKSLQEMIINAPFKGIDDHSITAIIDSEPAAQ